MAEEYISDNEIEIFGKRQRPEEETSFWEASKSEFNFQFPPSPKIREVVDDIIIEDRSQSPYSITATFEDLFSLPSATSSASSTRLQFGVRGGSGAFPTFGADAFGLNTEIPFPTTSSATTAATTTSSRVAEPGLPRPVVDEVTVSPIVAALQSLPQNHLVHPGLNHHHQQQQQQQQQQHQQQQQQQQQLRTAKASRQTLRQESVPPIAKPTIEGPSVAQVPSSRASIDLPFSSRSENVPSSIQTLTRISVMSSAASFDGVPAHVSATLRELSGNTEYVVLPSLLSSQFQRRKTHKISLEQVKSTCRQRAQTGDAFVGIYSLQERKDRMDMWAVSRSKRTFKKNIKYAHRHDLAGGRQRIGGRFVKSKGNEDIKNEEGNEDVIPIQIELEDVVDEERLEDIVIEEQGV
jgi:hypothetical protein